MLAYIISSSGTINGILDGKPFAFPPENERYSEVRDAVNSKNVKKLRKVIALDERIRKFARGRCIVQGGQIVYDGQVLHNLFTARILELMAKGFKVDPLLRFLERVMANPSQDAKNELYLFLEHSALPITDDGYFLAYKKVSSDYKSIHASPDGSHMDHSIGSKPFMPREEVDPDRNQTCSKGLHFCSLNYLPNYGSDDGGGDKVVILKIDPADVVAIPNDYENTKGRAWTYEVIADHGQSQRTPAFSEPVYDAGLQYGLKPSKQKFWNVRGANGRFAKKS